jgi:hypothetical protein
MIATFRRFNRIYVMRTHTEKWAPVRFSRIYVVDGLGRGRGRIRITTLVII